MKKVILIVGTLGLVLFFPHLGYAQQVKQKLTIHPVRVDSAYFIGFWVIPSSIAILPKEKLDMSTLRTSYNKKSGKLQFYSEDGFFPEVDTLSITYSQWPILFEPLFTPYKIESYTQNSPINQKVKRRQILRETRPQTDLFGNSAISKSGSLTRGFTAGNSQDVALESGLQLDLEGYINDEIHILATLTDQSTPIQPDGTTQNLREFDRVFIQIESPKYQVQLGDINVNFDESQFGYLNRRLQGVQATSNQWGGRYKVMASVARGVFRSQAFNGVEGVQGPYRLTGNNQEPFIIVIAGSERVFIDGQRLTRGEENDYIIDYGLGEIHFTPKNLITERSRITVDFQYLNQDFSRSIMAAQAISDPMFNGKLTVGARVLRETDDDNSLSQLSLTEEDISILREAGDSDESAVTSGVEPLRGTPEVGVTYYERRDSVIANESITYYRPIGNPERTDISVYRIRFSRTAEGRGSYRRSQNAINGITFEWVGRGQGIYDTLRVLPKPRDHQMVTINADYKPSSWIHIRSEIAASEVDNNRFSSLDDTDNEDFAHSTNISLGQIKKNRGIKVQYNTRYNGQKFEYFDRPEEIDFARKWNLDRLTVEEQRVHEVSVLGSLTTSNNMQLTGGVIERPGFEGRRLEWSANGGEEALGYLKIAGNASQSENETINQKGNWVNQNGEIGRPISIGNNAQLVPKLLLSIDRRVSQEGSTDSLLATTYENSNTGGGLSFRWKQALQVETEYRYRWEAAPLENELKQLSTGAFQKIRISYKPKATFSTENEVVFQQREINDRFSSNPQYFDNQSVFIHSITRFQSSSNALSAQLFYDIKTERTALLQETYIEVGAEIGQYVWVDENNDGIRQIDEFFLEQTPNEGAYIRQFIPGDELFPITLLTTRFRIDLRPDRVYTRRNRNHWFKKAASQIQWSGSIDVRENSRNPNESDLYLLRWSSFRNDSTTVFGRIGIRNDLTLFPKHPKWSLRLLNVQSKSLTNQAAGVENQDQVNWKTEIRYRFNRRVNITQELSTETDERKNNSISNRNYNLRTLGFQTSLDWLQSSRLQWGSSVGYDFKRDELEGRNAEVQLLKLVSSMRGNIKKIQFYSRLEWRNVQQKGTSSSVGNFELTEGSGPGSHWVWSLQTNYQWNTLMRSSLNYDGRTVDRGPTIHTVRFVVRAVF